MRDRLCILAIGLCCIQASQISFGADRNEWPMMVLNVAQCLTGEWQVEGKFGEERWVGVWSCRWMPKKRAYYITCSGSSPGDPASIQHLILVRSFHNADRGFLEHVFLPRTNAETAQGPIAGGKANSLVKRIGSDEFAWISTMSDGRLLSLDFRRSRKAGEADQAGRFRDGWQQPREMASRQTRSSRECAQGALECRRTQWFGRVRGCLGIQGHFGAFAPKARPYAATPEQVGILLSRADYASLDQGAVAPKKQGYSWLRFEPFLTKPHCDKTLAARSSAVPTRHRTIAAEF